MATQLHTVPSMDEFRTQLRRHNLKATRQRLAVHEAMMGLGHASADMVREELARQGSRVTVASVYNILSQLADLRIYGRRLSATNKMFFDVNTTRHIHLYDRENHTYRDLQDDELSTLVTSHLKRRKFKGFSVEDIDIQLIARPTKKSRTI
jgi:Fe2+ or Zn2+ uptake regulation protein